jgi:pilus assembly protein CpaE
MIPEELKISVLYGTGTEDPAIPEVLREIPRVKILRQVLDPAAFLAQHQERSPDLVLVDLDGMSTIPDWLGGLINGLPQAQIAICSESRDPDFLIRIMKLKVGAFLPLPLNVRELEDLVARVRAEREKARLAAKRGHVVACVGTKGGVGVTSIATNLAVALVQQTSSRVLLVDLARPFPQIGQFLDLRSVHSIADLTHSADSLDPVFLNKTVQKHPTHLDVLLGNPNYDLEAPPVSYENLEKIFAALREFYAWTVVDLGSWFDQFTYQCMVEADCVLLLTELTVPDLQNLRKIRSLLHAWELDEQRVKLVVNRYEKDYTLGLKDVENLFLQPAFYTLPSDFLNLIDAINQGVTLSEGAPRSKLWRKIKSMALELVALTEPKPEDAGKPGFLKKLFT